MAEAHRPAQHRGASELHLARLEQDRLVEREASGLGVFADEDAKQNGIARNLHDHTHRMVLRLTAAIWPSQTASRHSTTEPPILKEPFAVVHEIERLDAERGKRCVATAQS